MSDLLYEIKEQANCARKLETKIDEDTIKTFIEKYHSILIKQGPSKSVLKLRVYNAYFE